MVFAQKERLINDTKELTDYAIRLAKKGRVEQSKKIIAKRDFVLETLEKFHANPT